MTATTRPARCTSPSPPRRRRVSRPVPPRLVLPPRGSGMIPDVSSQNPTPGRPAPPVLDDLSKRIIEQLQEDGRRAYATIGKAVGLSEAAVRQRVQRLCESGVIQIVAVSDPLQV